MVIKINYTSSDIYVSTNVSPIYVVVNYSGTSDTNAVWGQITGTLSNQTDLQNALNAKFDDPTGTTSQYLRGDGSLATFPTITSGTVTSVGLTMPSAFSVANSPVTSSGTLAVTGAGTADQYVRGDGQLANFPTNGGGGSSVNYYLNGSVSQGTFGGDTYYEMSKTPIIGAGTNFTRTNAQGNGYIASFITDAGDPGLLNIPGGNWNVEFYFQASSSGSTPSFYAELYKVSSSNVFTLIASGSTNPEGITQGTVVDQYFTSIPVPQTALLATDRIAIRIFVTPSGRTITLHTEDNNLCEVLTTFSTGLNALNGLTAQVQYFATGTSGTDFAISSATDTHTFNLPIASGTNTGKLSNTDWTTFNNKVGGTGVSGQVAYWNGTNSQTGSNNLFWNNTLSNLGIGFNNINTAWRLGVAGNVAIEGFLSFGSVVGTGSNGYIQVSSTDMSIYSGSGRILSLYANANERARITTGGNLLVGGTTDGGQRLQVQGTTLLNGDVTFSSATGMFWDAANSRLGIGTNTPARIVDISSNGGRLRFTQNVSADIFVGLEFATNLGVSFGGFIGNPNSGEIRLNAGTSYFPTFYSNNTERARLTAAGRLLLGTTTESTYLLDVNGTSRFSQQSIFFAQAYVSKVLNSATIVNNSTDASVLLFAPTTTNNYGGVIGWAEGGAILAASISAYDDGSGGALGLSFATGNNTSISERFKISSTGAATFSSSVTATSFIKSGGTSSQYLMADGSVTTGSALTITNRQTASYTLALTDADKLVEMNVATANNLTVPLNSSVAFAIGTKIDIAQYGAGQTTVVATSGVAVRSAGGALKLAVQYSGASLVKIATDEWYLFGDITV